MPRCGRSASTLNGPFAFRVDTLSQRDMLIHIYLHSVQSADEKTAFFLLRKRLRHLKVLMLIVLFLFGAREGHLRIKSC